jgi:hypothetical protein
MNVSMILAIMASLGVGLLPATDGSEAFARMRLLVGNWQGPFTWTGARVDTGHMTATYHLTGNGTTLVEDLGDGAKPAMTSMYHLDNGDLRVTHYCGVGNQPRLKASGIDLASNIIRFDFVDITNLPEPDAPHVHGLTVHVVDADHLDLEFAFQAKGKESVEHITLTRIG